MRKWKKPLAFTASGFHAFAMNWNDTFTALFERCVETQRNGGFDYETGYSEGDLSFLAEIGYKRRELFDFVEDLVDGADLSASTALLVAAVRRDYLVVEQGGKVSGKQIDRESLPSREEALEGIAYLPRILVKARAKLRGELDPDTMFSCGGDRNFLSKNGGIHPADFLRRVWAAGDDDEKVVAWIKSL
jgi:hypothetical protein